jgi:RNA polymerase sigma factor (sigma-70 family)
VKGGKEMELKSFNHVEETELNFEDKGELIEQLMTLYVEKVYLLAFSFVKDKGIAEDISQEVFLKCYKYIDNFRGESSLKSWIYRITVNTSLDFLRKKNPKPLFFEEGVLDHFKMSESTETAFLNADRNERLLQTVLMLPIKYREVILLHYFLDIPVTEMAETLKMNTNTVKTRMKRGRDLLKKSLEKGMKKDGERA